ncbi:DegT/DnrJ/EryC1/StrS family aminotransferase [Candidatus Falkowbacteria bacterium]|nr:DegT/DnrJ/EryC1/StrS family aminotransferase [Candidatus Falkowbacteria bacterium]
MDFAKTYAEILPELSQAFEEFILNGEYIGGSPVERFESKIKERTGAIHAIACKSGTHALQLALLAAGIGQGDEVITVANTYYATAYAIRSVGAMPIFCEVDFASGLMDSGRVDSLITSRTKAVMPVHLYGAPVDLDALGSICALHGLHLIEDCSHAFGSSYHNTPIGINSDFACFSLYPTKNLGAFGDAGMVLTRSAEHDASVRRMLYLCDRSRSVFPPRAIHAMLDPLQAALLTVTLDAFPGYKHRRQELAGLYRKKLADKVRMLPEDPNSEVNPYVFPIFTDKRDQLLRYLKDMDIHVQVHYDTDLHRLPQFGGLAAGSLPITERHNREVLSLSVHPSLTNAEAEMVSEAVVSFINGN